MRLRKDVFSGTPHERASRRARSSSSHRESVPSRGESFRSRSLVGLGLRMGLIQPGAAAGLDGTSTPCLLGLPLLDRVLSSILQVYLTSILHVSGREAQLRVLLSCFAATRPALSAPSPIESLTVCRCLSPPPPLLRPNVTTAAQKTDYSGQTYGNSRTGQRGSGSRNGHGSSGAGWESRRVRHNRGQQLQLQQQQQQQQQLVQEVQQHKPVQELQHQKPVQEAHHQKPVAIQEVQGPPQLISLQRLLLQRIMSLRRPPQKPFLMCRRRPSPSPWRKGCLRPRQKPFLMCRRRPSPILRRKRCLRRRPRSTFRHRRYP